MDSEEKKYFWFIILVFGLPMVLLGLVLGIGVLILFLSLL